MTDILCNDCHHVRETTKDYPELVSCDQCGSYDLEYVHQTGDHHDHHEKGRSIGEKLSRFFRGFL